MFLQFFTSLRDAQVPVTLREYLTLMEALDADLAEQTVENFYYLSRAALVKDERNLDKFDRVFGTVFKGLENLLEAMDKAEIPEEWLKKLAEKYLTEEEKKQIEAMGWDKLMETLRKRLEEQKGRHQGGSKWIGTAGTSPFGAHGYNPEGVRIGQEKNRNNRAVKVWTAASSGISTAMSSLASATSRSRCAACVDSRAPARRTSSTSIPRSRRRRTTAISM
jgi:uncharacterized protein with von Willebrand factor type A (vWA) domain